MEDKPQGPVLVYVLYYSSWAEQEDYGTSVEGVFSTREKAVQALDRCGERLDENDTTEVTLTFADTALKDGIYSYYYLEEREVDKKDDPEQTGV